MRAPEPVFVEAIDERATVARGEEDAGEARGIAWPEARSM